MLPVEAARVDDSDEENGALRDAVGGDTELEAVLIFSVTVARPGMGVVVALCTLVGLDTDAEVEEALVDFVAPPSALHSSSWPPGLAVGSPLPDGNGVGVDSVVVADNTEAVLGTSSSTVAYLSSVDLSPPRASRRLPNWH